MFLLSLPIDNQNIMDKEAKDFLLREELERHLESMSNVANGIDPRQASKVVHPAPVIMMSALMGVFANCQTWNEIADFAEARIDFLRTFFPGLEESPSHDTIRRFFCLVNPIALENSYRSWALSMRKSMGMHLGQDAIEELDEQEKADLGRQIAIDGKTNSKAMNERGKYDSEGFRINDTIPKPMEKLHIVSAFLVDQCLSIGQEKVDSKENEIIAIPRLLDSLELHDGDVVTIDAIGTQKDIVSKIIEKQANYLLEVKGNQPSLMERIQDAMETIKRYRECEYVKEFTERVESHGLIVNRTCRTCSDIYFLGNIFREWEGIKTFGCIDNWRIDKATGEDVTERHYFITSLENDPKRILKFKRKHWGIENGLHWQLDVTFNEDDDRKRKNSAQNYSLITKMTLNILKNHQHKDKKASIKRKRMKAAWDEDYLKSLLIHWLKAF